MHDALWNPFVVKVGDFFAQDEVFKQRRAALPGLERVLVIGNRHTLVGCEDPPCCIYPHPVKRLDGCVEAIRCAAAGFSLPFSSVRVLPLTRRESGVTVSPRSGISALARPCSPALRRL